MKYELFIGLRYLRARRRETFISLITLISVVGVMIAVVVLNVTLALMTGLEEALRDRLLGFNGHILVENRLDLLRGYEGLAKTLMRENGVVAASPIIEGQVLVSFQGRVSGVAVRGIDPARIDGVISIGRFIKEGNLRALEAAQVLRVEDRSIRLPGVILGTALSSDLGVRIGDPVQLLSPMGTPTAMGVLPKIKRFVVVGLFNSGMYEYDRALIYMNLADAQQFFELGDAVTNIVIRTQDIDRARIVAQRIQGNLGLGYAVKDWSRLWPNLFYALRLEKTVYFLVLLLMVLIGAFNIISTLIMVVMEKRRDIAILQSMGATRRSIRTIFLIKGCLIGLVGTLLGVVLGYAICLLIERYDFIKLPEGVFIISTLPVRIYLSNFVVVGLASFLICLLASIYPARQAAKLDPVEIIRYE